MVCLIQKHSRECSNRAMIKVIFSTNCLQLMREFGIREDSAKIAINDRDQGLSSDAIDRSIAFRWFGDDYVLLVDSQITKKDPEDEYQRVRIIEVQAQLVLVLQ
jgi:hypothetical protein